MEAIDPIKLAAIKQAFSMPVKPSILNSYYAMLTSSEPEIDGFNRLIAANSDIEAKLKSRINSYGFGLKHSMGSINEALTKLGLLSINNLLTGIMLDECLSIDSKPVTNLAMFIGRNSHSQLSIDNLFCLASFANAGKHLMIARDINAYNCFDVSYALADHWHLSSDYLSIFELLSTENAFTTSKFKLSPIEFKFYAAVLSITLCCVYSQHSNRQVDTYLSNKSAALNYLGLSEVDFNELKERYTQQTS